MLRPFVVCRLAYELWLNDRLTEKLSKEANMVARPLSCGTVPIRTPYDLPHSLSHTQLY